MDEKSTAMYLAGHGSKTRPRLIELQYQRIQRYRRALLRQKATTQRTPIIYIDLRLPKFGMGSVDLEDVPAFKQLFEKVKNREFEVVYLDLDETNPALTTDYESSFVRQLLEASGATVLNAFTDDQGVFLRELKERCSELLGAPLPHLSMGMSGDFEVALEEGATIVRIGTALFGPRKSAVATLAFEPSVQR